MPSKSIAQQRFFGVVKGIQKGGKGIGKAKKAADDMNPSDVDDFAATKHDGLPYKVAKESKVRQLIRKMVREIMSEDFSGQLSKAKKDKFEKIRKEQSEVLGYKLTGTSDIKEGKTLWELTEQYVISERIEKDVEKAGKKVGIRFKKISHDITTNKFRNPKGDISKYGSDTERVRMNSWIADGGGGTGLTKQNYKEAGDKIIKILKRRYKLVKLKKYANSVMAIFFKNKKDPRTEFRITYAKTAAGPYIGYDGVKGQ